MSSRWEEPRMMPSFCGPPRHSILGPMPGNVVVARCFCPLYSFTYIFCIRPTEPPPPPSPPPKQMLGGGHSVCQGQRYEATVSAAAVACLVQLPLICTKYTPILLPYTLFQTKRQQLCSHPEVKKHCRDLLGIGATNAPSLAALACRARLTIVHQMFFLSSAGS